MKKTLLRTAVASVIAVAALGSVTPAFADGPRWDAHITNWQFCAEHVSVSLHQVTEGQVCAEHTEVDG
jgi:hypothetical protein